MYSIRRTCNLLHWKCVDILGHHGNLLRQINIDEAESVLVWDTPCQASFAMSSIRFRALGRAPLALAHKIIFNGMHLLPCRSTIIPCSIWHVFTSRKSGWWQCTHRRTWIQCDAAARLESIDTSWEYSSNLTGAYLDILHEIMTSRTTFKDKTLVHSFPRSHNAHSHQPQPILRYIPTTPCMVQPPGCPCHIPLLSSPSQQPFDSQLFLHIRHLPNPGGSSVSTTTIVSHNHFITTN